MASIAGRTSQRPVIGITGNDRWWSPSWVCIRFSVWLAGGTPVRLSVRHQQSPKDLDALIISGGDDIHPSLYGGDVMPKAHYDEARDELEKACIEYAIDNNLPLLGICRGHQLINVIKGGQLHSDIRCLRKKTSNRGTILPRKTAILAQTSELAGVLAATQGSLTKNPRARINSLHHQSVSQPGTDLAPCAWDLDNFIQATESTSAHDILSVQWHPEYLFYRAEQRCLFSWLVSLAKDRRGSAASVGYSELSDDASRG